MSDNTTLNLYRSCRIEQFPQGVLQDGQPAAGLLEPDFYSKPLTNGKTRAADVQLDTRDGEEWVRPGGGTSLFDRAGVFTKAGWLSFEIPQGTPIPDSLLIRNTGYNRRFDATHYQIEVRTMITKSAMQGALDNLARSAVARQVELAHGRTS